MPLDHRSGVTALVGSRSGALVHIHAVCIMQDLTPVAAYVYDCVATPAPSERW